MQPPESDPAAAERDSHLPRNLQDLLASDLVSVILGRMLSMVLSGVSLGERQAWACTSLSEIPCMACLL